MADPFSITIGSVTVAGVCIKLRRQIYELQKDIGGIEEELSTLLHDIKGLKDLFVTVEATYNTRSSGAMLESTEHAKVTDDLHLAKAL